MHKQRRVYSTLIIGALLAVSVLAGTTAVFGSTDDAPVVETPERSSLIIDCTFGEERDREGNIIDKDQCGVEHLFELANNVMKLLLWLAITGAGMLIFYKGVKLAVNVFVKGGDQQARQEVQKALKAVLIGLIFILGAFLIVSAGFNIIGYNLNGGNPFEWNESVLPDVPRPKDTTASTDRDPQQPPPTETAPPEDTADIVPKSVSVSDSSPPYKYTFIWENLPAEEIGYKVELYPDKESCADNSNPTFSLKRGTELTLTAEEAQEAYKVHLTPLDDHSDEQRSTACRSTSEADTQPPPDQLKTYNRKCVVTLTDGTKGTKDCTCTNCTAIAAGISVKNNNIVHATLAANLTDLKKAGNPSWTVTEAWPTTSNHAGECHYVGTCVDIDFNKGDPSDEEIVNFIKSARNIGLLAVWETRDAGRVTRLRSLSGVENRNAKNYAVPDHFSLYNCSLPKPPRVCSE